MGTGVRQRRHGFQRCMEQLCLVRAFHGGVPLAGVDLGARIGAAGSCVVPELDAAVPSAGSRPLWALSGRTTTLSDCALVGPPWPTSQGPCVGAGPQHQHQSPMPWRPRQTPGSTLSDSTSDQQDDGETDEAKGPNPQGRARASGRRAAHSGDGCDSGASTEGPPSAAQAAAAGSAGPSASSGDRPRGSQSRITESHMSTCTFTCMDACMHA